MTSEKLANTTSSPQRSKGKQCCFSENGCSDNSLSSVQDENSNVVVGWPPMFKDVLRRKKIQKTIDDFVQTSTCHGFVHCTDKEHFLRRLVWTFMVSASVAFSLQKVHQSATKYLSFPFNTKITIKYTDEQAFPAVSICNLNDMRMSKLNGSLLYELLESRKLSGGWLNLSSISSEQYRNITQQACHQIEHMLVECKMLGETCTYKDFTQFYQKQGECCYTINGRHPAIAIADKTKRYKSLVFEFNIENYEYYDAAEAGLRLILHDQKETPIDLQGITLPPGFTSFIEIKKFETRNLKKPYKTNCGSVPLRYFTYYSQSACELEHLTNHLVRKCKCKDEFMPGSEPTCSIQQLTNCTWPAWEKFNQLPSRCPIACETIHFNSILSFGQFPSNVHADVKAKEIGLPGTVQENRKFVRDNFLRVEIRYEDMSYSLMEQTPSYDFMVLLGDIGGQLGLFLGTSILTFMEFFDLIAMIIYTKYIQQFD